MCEHKSWTSIGVNELGNWENCRSCQTTRLVPNKNTAEVLADYKIVQVTAKVQGEDMPISELSKTDGIGSEV